MGQILRFFLAACEVVDKKRLGILLNLFLYLFKRKSAPLNIFTGPGASPMIE